MFDLFKSFKKQGGEKKMSGKGDVLIKVARIGTKAEEYVLNGNRTIYDALKAAGFVKKESEIVQVNGEEVDDMEMELEDGDRVVLVKNIQGGLI